MKYFLINGPFDGTVIELPHDVDRIALRGGHTLPGVNYNKVKPNRGIIFKIVPCNEAVYDEFADENPDIDPEEPLSMHKLLQTEEEIQKYDGKPLFFNSKKSGIIKE
jgi:hypothetical protein